MHKYYSGFYRFYWYMELLIFNEEADINDAMLFTIADVLKNNTFIEEIDITLDWNPITDIGAKKLAESLLENESLSQITIQI